jgi:hypothetical protein
MDPRVLGSLVGAILFLIAASTPAYSLVQKMGVKNKDMSLVVRSALVGVLTYLSMSVLPY